MTGLILLSALAAGQLQAQQFRTIVLGDGRVLVGDVLGLDGEAMFVRLPQGDVTLPLGSVRSLVPATEEDFQSQPPWVVWLLPVALGDPVLQADADEVDDALMGLLENFPAVVVGRAAEEAHPEDQLALAECGADVTCAVAVLDERAPTVTVGAELLVDPESDVPVLRLGSAYVGAPLAAQQVRVPYPAGEPGAVAQVLAGLYPLLHLDPDPARLRALATYVVPGRKAEPLPPPPPPEPILARDSRALDFVPIPGFSSIVQGDRRRAAIAWAVVVPGTAAMFSLSGYATWRRQQLALAGLGSYAVLTLAVNQVLGERSRAEAAQVAVLPLEGGAAVTATITPP